jgi:UDP-N-acetylmuramoylalanine--D-glutamate ligase
VAVYTHVTQDHLDRHGTVEAYRAQKRRLAELAPAGGRLVLNAEDPVSAAYASLGRVGSVLYRRSAPIPGGVGVVNGWVVGDHVERLPGEGGGPAATGPEGRVLPVGEIPLPGRHNVSNVLAAVGVGLVFGVAPDAIREALNRFRGVEHRLQVLGEIGGIRYVNDSQGTQPDAVIAALQSFDAPIVLIAGGRDKGAPLEELAATAVDRAEAVVLMGESAPLLERALRAAGHRAVHHASSMEEAVRIAARLAHRAAGPSGATVLLSPAAASFDMFPDYAARGRAFAAAVRALATAEKTTHG